MRCPNDSTDLIRSDHQGVDIHRCPTCQGIWLEASQLDQIVDQAIASQYVESLDGLDDLDHLDDGKGRNRRRDKYTDDFDAFEAPRKGKRRKNRRETVDEMYEY